VLCWQCDEANKCPPVHLDSPGPPQNESTARPAPIFRLRPPSPSPVLPTSVQVSQVQYRQRPIRSSDRGLPTLCGSYPLVTPVQTTGFAVFFVCVTCVCAYCVFLCLASVL